MAKTKIKFLPVPYLPWKWHKQYLFNNYFLTFKTQLLYLHFVCSTEWLFSLHHTFCPPMMSLQILKWINEHTKLKHVLHTIVIRTNTPVIWISRTDDGIVNINFDVQNSSQIFAAVSEAQRGSIQEFQRISRLNLNRIQTNLDIISKPNKMN